jgi:transposase-like protein
MPRRKWAAKTKALIVLEGLKGKPVAEICTEHQISQSLYYQWRDQFLANAAKAFDDPQRTRKTICFSKSIQMHDIVIGLFVNRYEFGVVV